MYHKLLHTEREGCRIKQNLPLFGQKAQYLLHHDHKVLRQEFVSLLTKGTGGGILRVVLSDSLNFNHTGWFRESNTSQTEQKNWTI